MRIVLSGLLRAPAAQGRYSITVGVVFLLGFPSSETRTMRRHGGSLAIAMWALFSSGEHGFVTVCNSLMLFVDVLILWF
jgi:hypothetical protein